MNKRLIEPIAFCGLLLAIGSMHGSLHLNLSESAPRGLWLERPIDRDTFKRGSWVSVCPPITPVTKTVAAMNILPIGDCPGLGVVPLLKPVGAVTGDVVRLYNGRSAVVNGKTIPNTIARHTLPAFPNGEYIVKPGEVWLFSSYSERSFDSRYFGPVKIDQVQGRAIPFITED